MNDDLRVRCAQLAEKLAALAGEVDELTRDAYAAGYSDGLAVTKSPPARGSSLPAPDRG